MSSKAVELYRQEVTDIGARKRFQAMLNSFWPKLGQDTWFSAGSRNLKKNRGAFLVMNVNKSSLRIANSSNTSC